MGEKGGGRKKKYQKGRRDIRHKEGEGEGGGERHWGVEIQSREMALYLLIAWQGFTASKPAEILEVKIQYNNWLTNLKRDGYTLPFPRFISAALPIIEGLALPVSHFLIKLAQGPGSTWVKMGCSKIALPL